MNVTCTRRQWLQQTGMAAGALALSAMLTEDGFGEHHETAAGSHIAPTARNVIFLFMSGGPSHVDTFDPKPELAKLDGKDVPAGLAMNVPRIKRAGLKNLMASPFKFQRYGDSGLPVSELLPATARCVDDLCVVRSLHHRNPVHGPAECVTLTGTGAGDRPSLGAWATYGLGSENQNLPSFIAMNLNTAGMQYPQASGWGPGFLPARYQGVVVDPSKGIGDVQMPANINDLQRREQLEVLDWLNRQHLQRMGEHSELEARIRSYEMAYRMQSTVPELFDISDEAQYTRQLYGLDQKETAGMGKGCLLARRMVERGIRFIQIRVGGWDAHGNLVGNHRSMAKKTDVPTAGLLKDLKQRGLLDQTLVVWGGEFGRTPTMEGRGKGRDHSPSGYTMWLAGGGVRGGQIVGQTDPIGYVPIERPVRISDFYASILRALGLDQHRLNWLHNGREELATVLGGDVIHEIFG